MVRIGRLSTGDVDWRGTRLVARGSGLNIWRANDSAWTVKHGVAPFVAREGSVAVIEVGAWATTVLILLWLNHGRVAANDVVVAAIIALLLDCVQICQLLTVHHHIEAACTIRRKLPHDDILSNSSKRIYFRMERRFKQDLNCFLEGGLSEGATVDSVDTVPRNGSNDTSRRHYIAKS